MILLAARAFAGFRPRLVEIRMAGDSAVGDLAVGVFDDCVLDGCVLDGCVLEGCVLDGCVLDGCVLDGCVSLGDLHLCSEGRPDAGTDALLRWGACICDAVPCSMCVYWGSSSPLPVG